MAREGRLRRWVYGAAAVVAALIAGPTMPLELAVWLSGELLLYVEVIAGVWLASRGASWTALRGWTYRKTAHVRQRVLARWRLSQPRVTGWLQWTFMYN